MTLHTSSIQQISAIQNAFNLQFPFLKLEFLHPNGRLNPTHERKGALSNGTKGGLKPAQVDKAIDVDESMTVNALQAVFKNEFGLEVQVLRQSGNLWLQTTKSGNWTLHQQNEHGREITSGVVMNFLSDPDRFDLSRGETD